MSQSLARFPRDPKRAVRIALVDDHHSVMEKARDQICGEFNVLEAVLARHVDELSAGGGDFDLVVLDLRLEDGTNAVTNVRTLQARGWPVLLYTQAGVDEIAPCVAAGVWGVVSKGAPATALFRGSRAILSGEPFLTDTWAQAVQALSSPPRLNTTQSEVLQLFAAGLLPADVGELLSMSEASVWQTLDQIRSHFPYRQLFDGPEPWPPTWERDQREPDQRR